MIKAIRSNHKSFREVKFEPGFNVVLAERVKGSTDKDSRNGLGKTTLIEIIHFCLGSNASLNTVLRSNELKDWTFIMDILLQNKEFTISRNTTNFSTIQIQGDFSDWPIQPDKDHINNTYTLKIKDWNLVLSYLVFKLPISITERKYSPSFRSLISYFIRKGIEAFNNPFKHHSEQKEWDIQINNAFLLGLNWEYASDLQILKDREKILRTLRIAASEGLLTGFIKSLGELESEKIRIEEESKNRESQLKTFKVHPQYYSLQEESNKLTEEIHQTVNNLTIKQQILDTYTNSLLNEPDVSIDKVKQIYKEAGFLIKEKILNKLNEVTLFHKTITENRKKYLETEINRLKKEIEDDKEKIKDTSDKRAHLLILLETHGALEEYSQLQSKLTTLNQSLEEIKSRIDNYKKFEEYKSALKIEKEELIIKMRKDYDERKSHIEDAISLFNRYSNNLYTQPGVLAIDITDNGFKYNVDIRRARSQGVNYMKIFCYDLTLTNILSKNKLKFDIPLIHDSTIFDGVDERQIAKALELVSDESNSNGFQYICEMNSDMVPYNDFSGKFKSIFDQSVRITFTDATADGGLLGLRF